MTATRAFSHKPFLARPDCERAAFLLQGTAKFGLNLRSNWSGAVFLQEQDKSISGVSRSYGFYSDVDTNEEERKGKKTERLIWNNVSGSHTALETAMSGWLDTWCRKMEWNS